MNLPRAPGQYLRETWQAILERLRVEDLRNAKRDEANRFAGPLTAAGGLEVSGAMSLTGVITPAQITADQNDYNPAGFATANVLRLSTDAARNITGLASDTGGGQLLLLNVGSFNLVLTAESGSSAAANRFAPGGNALIAPGHGCWLWYDAASLRWRIVGRSNATYG